MLGIYEPIFDKGCKYKVFIGFSDKSKNYVIGLLKAPKRFTKEEVFEKGKAIRFYYADSPEEAVEKATQFNGRLKYCFTDIELIDDTFDVERLIEDPSYNYLNNFE